MTVAQNDVEQLARQIAEQEIGGPPPRCTGHKADRYNAAFNAVAKAAAAFTKGSEPVVLHRQSGGQVAEATSTPKPAGDRDG
ncbi:hypothetical protein K7957_07595 [Sphingomonas yunnanensis]|uniref:hypothetical protein n=1 Tax=Sphingomonas yunnanensis TaxID=310400 RepID=UPI001CA67837|nr:hypothetical protein [Sphingomonas yunnanensis]MBY9062791.1 hypothetical protein [Sphingomonas yunnanensis]